MSAQVTIFLLGIYHPKSRSSLTILQRCEDVVRMIIDYTQADVLKALRLFLVNVRKLKGNDPLLKRLMSWKGGKEALRQLYPRSGWTLCVQLTDDMNLSLPDEAPNWRWLLEQLYAISWLGHGGIGSSLESDGDGYVFSQDQIQGLRFLAESPNRDKEEDSFTQHFGHVKTDAQLLSEMSVLFGEPSLQWFLNVFENIRDVYRWKSRFKEQMVMGDMMEGFSKYDERTRGVIQTGLSISSNAREERALERVRKMARIRMFLKQLFSVRTRTDGLQRVPFKARFTKY